MRIIVQKPNEQSRPQPSTSSTSAPTPPSQTILSANNTSSSSVTQTNTQRKDKEKRVDVNNNSAQEDEGYNSSDETNNSKEKSLYERKMTQENEKQFEELLKKKKNFTIRRMNEDGNCLFRAIADQVYGDAEMHNHVRKQCLDYMEKERDYFSQFVTEDIGPYLERKKKDKCFGNHVEIQAMAELYNRPIEIYSYTPEPINTFQGAYTTNDAPIRLSYHNNNHYNSVIDPYTATIGVGLGLPSFQPGLADELQLKSAINASEESVLDKELLYEYQQATDYEATNQELEQAAIAESIAEYYRFLSQNH